MRDIIWVILEVGTSLFEILLFFIFFDGFFAKKKTAFIYKAIIFFIAYIIHFSVSAWFFDVNFVMLASSTLIAMGICLLLYSGKLYARVFSPLLLIVLMVAMEMVTWMVFSPLLRIDPQQANVDPVSKLVGMIIKNILTLVAIKGITYYRKSDTSDIKTGYRFMLMIVPASSLVLAYVIFDLIIKVGWENASIAIIGLLCLLYVNIIIFALFESYMRQLGKEYRYQLTEKQLDMQLAHYNQLAESRAHIREIWHDFKNHVNCMQVLYDNNDRESLGRYIKNLSHIEEAAKVIDTGNPVIDALLNNKQSIAAANGIKFDTELMIPSGLSIPPADICVVLGNSLDNAIEACCRIKSPDIEKYIRLVMGYRNDYLVVTVVNSYEQMPKKQGGVLKTSKSSPELHGLGMQSIDRTVRQYDGNMKVNYKDNVFTLELIMLLKTPVDDRTAI
jgi:two-component system sensor histidine kinase AgrC